MGGRTEGGMVRERLRGRARHREGSMGREGESREREREKGRVEKGTVGEVEWGGEEDGREGVGEVRDEKQRNGEGRGGWTDVWRGGE